MDQMTTGASNDFERATDMARRMVSQWGMSEGLGTMVSGEVDGEVFIGRSIVQHKQVSEETLRKVDQEIKGIIDTQYARAHEILTDNKDKVEVMTKCLLEWETINEDQINDIVDGKEPRPPAAEAQDDGKDTGGQDDGGEGESQVVSDNKPAEA